MIKSIKRFLGDIQYAIAYRDIATFTLMTPTEKREILKKYADTHVNFVETGTYLGETTAEMAKLYKNVYTVEVLEDFYLKARDRFSAIDNVTCYYGDSAIVLSEIIASLQGPTVFWLDGHYSGPHTGRSRKYETPILQELKTIFSRKERGDIILIDDARAFCGRKSYPRISKLNDFVRRKSNFILTIQNDIIRLQYDPEWS